MGYYNKIFARFYDPFMASMEKELYEKRKALIENLEGEVLEIGSGTGVNFEFYSEKANVLAIEPSENMMEKAKAKLAPNQNIRLENWGMHYEDLANEIQHQSLDAIVCTLVMCTVPEPEKAFEIYKKWLKPDGKLIVMEHIHSKNQFKGTMQTVFNPLWKKVGDGCNLNRKTDQIIKNAGFVEEHSDYFKLGLDFYYGVFHI